MRPDKVTRCRECNAAVAEADHVCKACGALLRVECAACGRSVAEIDTWGDGDVGDDSLPSFCSEACYRAGGDAFVDLCRPSEQPFSSLYLTERGRERADRHFWRLERAAGVEVALGSGDWINVYTTEEWRLRRVAMVLGFAEVIEISSGDAEDGL